MVATVLQTSHIPNGVLMNGIRMLVMDLGNVVVSFDRSKVSHAFAQRLNRPFEEVDEIVNGTEGMALLARFELGAIGAWDYYAELCARLRTTIVGGGIGEDEFWHIHSSLFCSNEAVIEVLRRVRRKRPNLLIAALTNTDPRRLLTMQLLARIPFDRVIASCEIGAAKPDSRIFLQLLQDTAKKAHECLFVDDVAQYCENASELGMHTHHYTSARAFEQTLCRYGVL